MMERNKKNNKQEYSFSELPNTLFIKLCRSFNSRQVTVKESSGSQKSAYYRFEQISANGVSMQTENFLQGNLLYDLLDKEPLHILKKVLNFYDVSKEEIYLLIAADLCRFFAGKMTGEDRLKAHLSSLYYCYQVIHQQLEQKNNALKVYENFFFSLELQLYNEAIAGIFSYLKENSLLDSQPFTAEGLDGVKFQIAAPEFHLSVPRNAVSDFSLCSDYTVNTLRLINRHTGIGVPLVARVTDTTLSESLRTPPGLTVPVTFFFQFHKDSNGLLTLEPHYQDTSIQETFRGHEKGLVQDKAFLALDFTTPLACFMNALEQRNLLAGMLHPEINDEISGLYMIEPYRPDKIPVVFIHGLMSGPETWGQMLNSLKFNPKIRQKYQFWFFSYSTGMAVPLSTKKLQHALLSAQKEFCTEPEATENFNRMVLVGHSMGGLLARTLMQKNPDEIIRHFAHLPWNEAKEKLNPEDQKLVEDFMIFNSLPFVKRIVFMAVPHRGAAMAKRGLAKLGINLIRMPQSLLDHIKDFRRIMKKLFPDANIRWCKNSFITGIDNLKPDGYFISWLKHSQLKDGIPFHSIIGNRNSATEAGGSDGIVDYSSSHLDGAESEYIVKSAHNVHNSPPAILELMRILLLHADCESKKRE